MRSNCGCSGLAGLGAVDPCSTSLGQKARASGTAYPCPAGSYIGAGGACTSAKPPVGTAEGMRTSQKGIWDACSGAGGGFPSWGYYAIGAGVVAVVLGGVYYYRKS